MKKIAVCLAILVFIPLIAASPKDALKTESYDVNARTNQSPATQVRNIDDGRALGDILLTINLAAIGMPGDGYDNGGLSWDGQYLYVDNMYNNNIYIVDPTGPTLVGNFPAPPSLSWGIGHEQNLWITETNVLNAYEYTYAGAPTGNSFYAAQGGATWMGDASEWWPDGEIWILAVGGTNRLYKFSVPGGTYLGDIGNATWTYISQRGVTYDPFNDKFWVGGWNSDMVWEINSADGSPTGRQFPSVSIASLAYDWQSTLHPEPVLWVASNEAANYIFMVDPDNPQPVGGILYVDDDDDAALSGYFETALDNIGMDYDVWNVIDSGDVTPTEAVMSNYSAVIWTTGDDFSSTFVGTDTIEMNNYLNGGGKLWLSSEDILYDLGPVSWLHVASYTSDIGCDTATGVGPIMTGTSFATTAGTVFDYSDEINGDSYTWSEMQNEDPAVNTIAMDTSSGLPYFLFFNAFPFENINNAADRDTMALRILTWMGLGPVSDVGTQAIIAPVGVYFLNDAVTPQAQVKNFGDLDETFPVILTMTHNAAVVYADTVSVTLTAGESDTVDFNSYTFTDVGTYDVVCYTELAGDMNPANDTVTAQADVYEGLIPYIIVDLDPTPLTGPWLNTTFNSWGISGVYTTNPAVLNADSLALYQTAWFCTGIYSNYYSYSTTEATAIGTYLATGRRAYFEGGDAWGFVSARTVLCPLFGIDPSTTSDGSADLYTVDGQANGQIPEVAGQSWTYTGENNYIDRLGLYASPPNGGVVEGFLWNTSVSYWTGAAYDQGSWKTVALSHELGGDVAGSVPGDSLLSWIANYLDLTTGIAEQPVNHELRTFGFSPRMATLTKGKVPINYTTTAPGHVSLMVYDGTGRLVTTIVDAYQQAGDKSILWDNKDVNQRTVANGVYFLKLEAEGKAAVHKLILVR